MTILHHTCLYFGIVKDAQGYAFKVISFSFENPQTMSMNIMDHTTCVACTMRLIDHLGPFGCAHVRDLASTCHFHHSMHHDIYALCVASNLFIICSYHMFGCNSVISSHMPCPIASTWLTWLPQTWWTIALSIVLSAMISSLHPMHIMLGLSCTWPMCLDTSFYLVLWMLPMPTIDLSLRALCMLPRTMR